MSRSGRKGRPAWRAARLGQEPRLVVAAGKEPGPMEGHRRHQIGLGQELGPRPGQPAAEGGRQIGPVGMLEGEQQGRGCRHRSGTPPGPGRRPAGPSGRPGRAHRPPARPRRDSRSAGRRAVPGTRSPTSSRRRARRPPFRRRGPGRSRRSAAAGPDRGAGRSPGGGWRRSWLSLAPAPAPANQAGGRELALVYFREAERILPA